MELLYSVRRKPLKCEPPHFERADPEIVRPLVTISSCNIIAFSSPTELQDVESDTWGGHVYVCDLDTPWDSHKVVSTTHPVSAIEWDNEGKQLMVATTEGEVSVFGQKDFLLNEWTCLYTANFPGERIIKGIFFHNGRRIAATDKKADAPLTEKFTALRCTPTLKGFGGLPVPGVCVITSTGLVGCVCRGGAGGAGGGGGGEPARAMCSLRQQRDHVTHATMAHKNGSIVIAAVCRGGPPSLSARRVVRCAALGVSRGCGGGAAAAAPTLHVQPLPSVHVQGDGPITAITWCQNEDTDSLLVGGSTLTLWKLTERSHAVHKMLAKGPVQGNTTPGGGPKPSTDCFNTLMWQQTASWSSWASSGSTVTALAAGRLALAPPHALLATPSKIHLLARDDHHYICTRVVSSGPESVTPPPKKVKHNGHGTGTEAGVCGCALSWLGGAAVMVDAHAQILVYCIQAPHNAPTPLSIQHTSTLLEYALVSGYDCLDVLLTLKPSVVEAIYERITESFQRQPAAVQQFYFHSWLKMRIALCRIIPTASTSLSWLTCLSTLWSTWSACITAARADDRPDDRPLAMLLDDTHPDHDKALPALEFKLEPSSELQPLWPLRRLLQRALDIAATVLAQQPPHPHHTLYDLSTDQAGLTLLRKVLVLARGAGLGDAAMSRALARLHPPKPDVIEECHALAALSTARIWEALPRVCVSAPHGRPPPLYLEYGVTPENLRVSPEPPPACTTEFTPNSEMDSIRYMYLSTCSCRQCGRCGARALPHPQPARHPLQRAHDARFAYTCRCGGKWTLVSNY